MENKDVFELIIDNAIEIFLAFDNDNCICKINEMAKKELQLDDNAIGTSIVFIFQNGDISELIFDGLAREMGTTVRWETGMSMRRNCRMVLLRLRRK